MKAPTHSQVEKFFTKHDMDFNYHRAATGSRYYEIIFERGDVSSDEFETMVAVLRVSDHEGFDFNGYADLLWNICPEDLSWDGAKAAILEILKEWPGEG